MAMNPRSAPAGKDNESKLPLAEQITYLPGEGDPPSTKWHGIVFHANVPKPITKPELIGQARNNRFFHVGEFDKDKHSTAVVDNSVPNPKTSMEYRAHFVAWYNKLVDIHDLVNRWIAEEPMRQACEVGTDDYNYIGSILRPKMHELAKAAGLNEADTAALWTQRGVFQLPF